MGTRHLTIVIDENNETKVAQYGQWDGYPAGQGTTVVEFLRMKGNLELLKEKLKLVRFPTKEDEKAVDDFMESIGCTDGWMNTEQANEYHKVFPLLTRDNGAEILNMLLKIEQDVFLKDSTSFAGDGLFCEYAYVIDLYKNTFEIYEGFGKEPLPKNAMFKYLEENKDNNYYPVRMVKKYSLKRIPRVNTFLKHLEPQEE